MSRIPEGLRLAAEAATVAALLLSVAAYIDVKRDAEAEAALDRRAEEARETSFVLSTKHVLGRMTSIVASMNAVIEDHWNGTGTDVTLERLGFERGQTAVLAGEARALDPTPRLKGAHLSLLDGIAHQERGSFQAELCIRAVPGACGAAIASLDRSMAALKDAEDAIARAWR